MGTRPDLRLRRLLERVGRTPDPGGVVLPAEKSQAPVAGGDEAEQAGNVHQTVRDDGRYRRADPRCRDRVGSASLGQAATHGHPRLSARNKVVAFPAKGRRP